MKRVLVTMVALSVMVTAVADDDAGVLLRDAKVADRPAAVLDVVASAFIGRGWSVDGVDQTSVTASLDDSKLRIRIEGTSLMYEEIGRMVTIAVGTPMQGNVIRRKASNSRWRNNIRKDVSAHLARLGSEPTPAVPKAVAEPRRSVADRLAELDSLRVSGVISEAEYSQKRQEILKSL